MDEVTQKITTIEKQIEKALWELEILGALKEALKVYQAAEIDLEALKINIDNPAYSEAQRVLSYCLMRQGNLLRQLGKSQEAFTLSAREIAAARLSGDQITLARALMSNGTNLIITGDVEGGLKQFEEARVLFESGDSVDHKQGLGWYMILQADLANAGMVKKEPAEVIEISTRALDLLMPIENWPGVARAYAARATAHEKLGNTEQAVKDRQEQAQFEKKVKQGEAPG